MTEELKPCPFCGGEILSRHGECGNISRATFCADCGCFGPHQAYDTLEPIPYWNTRAPQWQPIETAPKDGTTVLIFSPEGIEIAYLLDDKKTWLTIEGKFPSADPSHWMPLPEAPSK